MPHKQAITIRQKGSKKWSNCQKSMAHKPNIKPPMIEGNNIGKDRYEPFYWHANR